MAPLDFDKARESFRRRNSGHGSFRIRCDYKCDGFSLTQNFPDQAAGTTSAALDVTLTNTGAATLVLSSVTVTGQFSQTNTCQTQGGTPAGQSCTISVRFSPTAAGPRSGLLAISTNAGNSEISLAGNGSGPLALSGIAFDFGSVRVWNDSPANCNRFKYGRHGSRCWHCHGDGSRFHRTYDCPSSIARQ
jgi:hypothetical protein